MSLTADYTRLEMWKSVLELALEHDLPQVPVDGEKADVVVVGLQLEFFAVPVCLQLRLTSYVLLFEVFVLLL